MTPRSLVKGPNGQPLLPSVTVLPDGRPRFYLPILPELANTDPGVKYLVQHMHRGPQQRRHPLG